MNKVKEGLLLHLPLELLLKISKYISFTDLWYLATCSTYCRKIAYKLIWHRYQIDLNKRQLSPSIYAALAYVSRYGYQNNEIDHAVIQSVCNRLAVEIDDKSPSKNWEYCLDFYLDKTLGMTMDHVLLDPLLDTIPKHAAIINNNMRNKHVLMSEFHSTKMGKLITVFLSTLHSTLLGLFDTEATTKIFHRLLITHLNRQMDSLTHQYHYQLTYRACPEALYKVRLYLRILIRFIGTLVQTDLFSMLDLEIMTRQRIIHSLFYKEHAQHLKKKPRLIKPVEEDIEFQIEILLDLSRAIILLEQSSKTDLNTVLSLLNETVSTLISTQSNEHHFISSTTTTTTT